MITTGAYRECPQGRPFRPLIDQKATNQKGDAMEKPAPTPNVTFPVVDVRDLSPERGCFELRHLGCRHPRLIVEARWSTRSNNPGGKP